MCYECRVISFDREILIQVCNSFKKCFHLFETQIVHQYWVSSGIKKIVAHFLCRPKTRNYLRFFKRKCARNVLKTKMRKSRKNTRSFNEILFTEKRLIFKGLLKTSFVQSFFYPLELLFDFI